MEKDNKKPTLEEVQQYFKHAKKVACCADNSLIFDIDEYIKEDVDCYYIGKRTGGINNYAILWSNYHGWATIVEVKEDANDTQRTIKEWFELVEDDKLKKKLFKYAKKYTLNGLCFGANSFSEALVNGFNWGYTKEKGSYWSNICDNPPKLKDPNNIEVVYDVVSSLKNPDATHYELWKDTEAIDVIKKTLTPEEYNGYLKGNILKYKLREKGQDESDKVKIKDYTAELNSIL